ncbi:hypothetical protein ACFLQR_03115, partial [Verrucomicrobiota bacterium]
AAVEKVTTIGIVYEQVGPTEYAEGNRWKGTAFWQLIDTLTDRRRYDQFLNLHQGLCDRVERWQEHDCWLEYPCDEWIPEAAQRYSEQWATHVCDAWEQSGGRPDRKVGYYEGFGSRPGWSEDGSGTRRKWVIDWVTMKSGTPELTVEVQINSKNTPREKQLALSVSAIAASVDRLIHD